MPSVAKFLIERMSNAGIGTAFTIPGDYILNFCKKVNDSESIELVGTTDESAAGFAADAYARIHGIGCVVVTYNVGSLKCVNAIANAHAERSPVVIIVGSPGIKERDGGILLHHTVGTFDTQREIFSHITCANTVLSDPNTAAYEIDRVFTALKEHRQPVYIELPRDVADRPISYDVEQGTPKVKTSDPTNLAEAVNEVVDWVKEASNPVILAGVEVSRFGLGEELVRFSERTNIPMFTEILGKSTVPERHPLSGGVYSGNAAPEHVRRMVDESDCILMLGVMLTDMVLGSAKPNFTLRQTVRANIGSLKVSNHNYTEIVFPEFCHNLFNSYREIGKKDVPQLRKKPPQKPFRPNSGGRLTTQRFFDKIDSIITRDMAIITDVGDSLFGAIDLTVSEANAFISPAYYTTMGMAIPGALGICMAKPNLRPIVLVGDGAFQMSMTEISTLVRRNLNPIIFVLNNGGYTTERFLLDGTFNDIHDWEYQNVVSVFRGGVGFKVTTEQELEDAVTTALNNKQVSVINVVVDSKDITDALVRVTAGLSKNI